MFFFAGTMSEMLLNVIREEIARSEGQKWRRCIERVGVFYDSIYLVLVPPAPRNYCANFLRNNQLVLCHIHVHFFFSFHHVQMYQDVLLFLPATQFSSERMGVDFDLPNSQVLLHLLMSFVIYVVAFWADSIIGTKSCFWRCFVGAKGCLSVYFPSFPLLTILLSLFFQVETIRKEVQAFLVVRAVHRQLQAINNTTVPCPETETAGELRCVLCAVCDKHVVVVVIMYLMCCMRDHDNLRCILNIICLYALLSVSFLVLFSVFFVDNLYASITDKGFLCLEEKNLMPANSTVGKCLVTCSLVILVVYFISLKSVYNAVAFLNLTIALSFVYVHDAMIIILFVCRLSLRHAWQALSRGASDPRATEDQRGWSEHPRQRYCRGWGCKHA